MQVDLSVKTVTKSNSKTRVRREASALVSSHPADKYIGTNEPSVNELLNDSVLMALLGGDKEKLETLKEMIEQTKKRLSKAN